MGNVLHILIERAITEKGYAKVVTGFVEKYESILSESWVEESDKAIDEAIKELYKAKTDKVALVAMLAVLTDRLKSITSKVDDKKLKALTDGLYRTSKQFEAAKLKSKVSISKLDKEVIVALGKDGPYWINEFYNTHLSTHIADIGRKTIVESGIGREKSGKIMEWALRNEFALSGGKYLESVVPAPFAGNVSNYTRIVTATVGQRCRVYPGISAMSDAGIKTFEFIAMMDERTSEMCQEMNGRIFAIESGISVLEKVAAVETPEGFKEAAPWPKNVDEIKEIAGKGSFENQSKNLEESGIVLPPLHGF